VAERGAVVPAESSLRGAVSVEAEFRALAESHPQIAADGFLSRRYEALLSRLQAIDAMRAHGVKALAAATDWEVDAEHFRRMLASPMADYARTYAGVLEGSPELRQELAALHQAYADLADMTPQSRVGALADWQRRATVFNGLLDGRPTMPLEVTG
jgi:hypothetical protein